MTAVEDKIRRKNRFKRKRRVNIARLTRVSFLPSIFTIASLFLGFLAVTLIIKGKYENAVYFITGSAILDGFDGTVARLTKTESNFGVQLDSLVDAVAFGMVTSVLIYQWGFKMAPYPVGFGKVIGFVFLAAGVIRLARFNVLTEAHAVPANIFMGLPIPLGALSIGSVVLLLKDPPSAPHHIIAFSIFVILIAFLMVSNVRYRTMKKIKSKNNLLILLLLAAMIAFTVNFPTYTIPALTFLYLISPIFFYITGKLGKNKPPVPAPAVEQTPPPDSEKQPGN